MVIALSCVEQVIEGCDLEECACACSLRTSFGHCFKK